MKRLLFASIFSIILVVIAPLFHACNENASEDELSASLILQYTAACGWCAGSKMLTIENNEITYNYFAVCSDSSKQYNRALTQTEADILNLTDFSGLIEDMEIDECGVCADGCDEKIAFKQNDEEYYIRFTKDETINGIIDYVTSLRQLMQQLEDEIQ